LRLAGQRLEARARHKGTKLRIFGDQLERVGLHELRHRSVAERHIRFADLAVDVALGRRDRAGARSKRRINPPETVSRNTEREDGRGR
jgi:hypothetical protein